MRTLMTSASGMAGQQIKLDTIANNLANVNTTGFKQQDVQFKDLLYAQIEQKPEAANLQGRLTEPGLRIGHGVMASHFTGNYAQGSMQETKRLLDVAIAGNGFFELESAAGATFTRDGSLHVGELNGSYFLTNAQGRRVLGANGQPIDLTNFTKQLDTLKIGADGAITVTNAAGASQAVGQLGIFVINNPDAHLENAGGNLLMLSAQAQRQAAVQPYANVARDERPRLQQGYLEQSNVDMSTQMTEMIVAQRAYTMNARMVQTADQMMGMANNLRS